MAGVTWGGLVRPTQGKGRFGMPAHRKLGGAETLDRVTFLALKQAGPGQGLAAMGVAVTIPAGCELRLFPFLGVAFGAGHRSVPTQQGVPGFGVIERGPLDQEPTTGGMALTAVVAQGPGVRIPVAISTGSMGQAGKNQRWFDLPGITCRDVALGASDFRVFARQGEGGLVVNEQRCGPPAVGVVTNGTRTSLGIGASRLPVHIRVTGCAGRFQTQICAAQILAPGLQTACIDDEFGIVALPASEFRVPARLFETDGPVIKTLGTVRPVDQIVIFALMLHVAVHTLAESLPCMHPGSTAPHGRNFLVAIQALITYVTASELVAAGTLFQAFEVGMGMAQRTGR